MGFPASYRQLAQYSARYAEGETIYAQGEVPEHIYVVLRGRIDFCIVDPNGEVSVVAEAQPGALAGHVAAVTGRPTSAAAVAGDETVVIGIPVAELATAFKIAPELAVELIHAFAGSDHGRHAPRVVPQAVVDVTAEGSAEAAQPQVAAADGRVDLVGLTQGWDEGFFFADTATCPVSGTRFEFLRVRTSGVAKRSRLRPTTHRNAFSYGQAGCRRRRGVYFRRSKSVASRSAQSVAIPLCNY